MTFSYKVSDISCVRDGFPRTAAFFSAGLSSGTGFGSSVAAFLRGFRALLVAAMRLRWVTIAATVATFVAAIMAALAIWGSIDVFRQARGELAAVASGHAA